MRLISVGRDQALSYASRKSFRGIPACVQIVLSVDDFIFGWLGMVRGVFEPSGLIRSIEICSLSRIRWKPKSSKVFMTLCFGASTGNFKIATIFLPLRQMLQEQVVQFQGHLSRTYQYESGSQILHPKVPPHMYHPRRQQPLLLPTGMLHNHRDVSLL